MSAYNARYINLLGEGIFLKTLKKLTKAKKSNFFNMNTSKFEIADYLDNKELIAAYLNTALKEGDQEDFIEAINNVAKTTL